MVPAHRHRRLSRATTAARRSSPSTRWPCGSSPGCPLIGPLGAALLVSNGAFLAALVDAARAHPAGVRLGVDGPRGRAVPGDLPDGVLLPGALHRVDVPAAVDRARSGSRDATAGRGPRSWPRSRQRRATSASCWRPPWRSRRGISGASMAARSRLGCGGRRHAARAARVLRVLAGAVRRLLGTRSRPAELGASSDDAVDDPVRRAPPG